MSQAAIDFSKITVRRLEFSDDLSNFSCNQDDRLSCDDFIHKSEEAKLFQKQRQGITYLFSYDEQIVGYVTLAMSSISAKRMSKYDKTEVSLKFYPSLLIGRLAVGNDWRRRGVGKYLCDWCLGVAISLSQKVGCRYVIVETDQSNVDFYVNCDFQVGKTLEEDKSRAMWMYQRVTVG